MGDSKIPSLTIEILKAYSNDALQNSDELLTESSLLLKNGHFARSYFLSVSSIEEVGKSLQAFDAQHRNLSDPAVRSKLKRNFEDHSMKINYALFSWALSAPDTQPALKVAMDLMTALRHGREPSMYSSLRRDPDRAQTPREVVRPKAAQDCLRLARDCLAYARRHLREKTPSKFTSAHEKIFTMKSAKFQDMLNTEDFWWYFIAQMEAGQHDLAEAVIGYQRNHIETDTLFRQH